MAKVQDFLDTEKGRVLLNYLYSWGAAIVILGALFKLTHIKGANLMLFLGMGTEVLVFFISGFEKPFIPNQKDDEDDVPAGSGTQLGGNIYISGTVGAAPAQPVNAESAAQPFQPAAGEPAQASAPIILGGGMPQAQASVPVVTGGGQLDLDGIEDATKEYIDKITELTEKIDILVKQSESMGKSTDELETLERNLISINTFYEMQLRAVSNQMDNMDQVKEQTARMVAQIEELNRVYARMVEALKVNSGIKEA